jgi:TM2 domain-containing membrane protein YozV
MELLPYTNGMTAAQQAAFYNEYANQKKDPTTGLLLSFFLGGVGAHKYYMGNDRLGLAYLLFCWTLIPTALGILEALVTPRRVRKHNRALAEHLSEKVRTHVVDQTAQPQLDLPFPEPMSLPLGVARPVRSPKKRLP